MVHRRFLAHFRAFLRRVIEQDLVELRPRHLIGAIGLRTEPVFEIKFHPVVGAGAIDGAAELLDETGPLEFLMQAEARKRLHAERQERFADVKAREFIALENDDAPAGLRQQRGRHTARGTAADDRHIIMPVLHAATKVAKMFEIALGESGVFLLRSADAFLS